MNLISLCKSTHLMIIIGRFGADRGIGRTTCSTARGSSTVDYALVSPKLLTFITNFLVDTFDSCLSDALSAIVLEISLKMQ